MTAGAPLVSIVVPMRDVEAYVGEAVSSLLVETAVAIEVIVVDDGSRDGSRARVESLAEARLRVIEGPRRGIAASFNAGLAQVRGSIVMRCDADDTFPPGRVRRQVEWLTAHPDVAGVCGAFTAIDARGRDIVTPPSGADECEIGSELTAGIVRTHLGTYAMRAEALRSLGGCREWFASAEDVDLQLRLGEVGRVHYRPEVAYRYRLHRKSSTHLASRTMREFYERSARELQRQRRDSGADDLQRGLAPPQPPRDLAPPESAPEHIQALLLGEAWRVHGAGEKSRALMLGVRALRARPASTHVWRSVAALLWKAAPRPKRT